MDRGDLWRSEPSPHTTTGPRFAPEASSLISFRHVVSPHPRSVVDFKQLSSVV